MTPLIIHLVNAIPDPVRLAIMPALKLVSLILGLDMYEDGTFDS